MPGEIAEMRLDGDVCQGCGVYLGDGDGIPRFCSACGNSQREKFEAKVMVPARIKVVCPKCGKRVKASGYDQHRRDVHQ